MYEDRKQFGSETKTFTIGEKRAERVVETMGPGAYSPERAETITKTRTATVNMGSSPARASIVKTTSIDVAPGQYDDRSYEMSKSTKTFTIGEKRAEIVKETMGPGAYSPDRAETITKTRTATVNMGSSPARASIVKTTGIDIAPGQYDDRSYEIAKSSKNFTIGEKRVERIVETMGPGAYSPDRAETITKTRTATVNMGSSPARASIVKTTSIDVAPGQYDDRSYEISNSKKGFIIGEKREERIVETMGPGAYSPDRAETITKTRSTTINMGSSPARASIVKKTDIDIAPGQYDDRSYEISKSSKNFTIGEKRAERVVETMGPGAYSPDRAETVTKTRSQTVNIGSSPARASIVKTTGVDIAPG